MFNHYLHSEQIEKTLDSGSYEGSHCEYGCSTITIKEMNIPGTQADLKELDNRQKQQQPQKQKPVFCGLSRIPWIVSEMKKRYTLLVSFLS